MLNSSYQFCLRAIALSAVLTLTGCIAHAPGSGGGGGSQPLTVTVSPTPNSSPVSTSSPSIVQLAATVGPSGTSQSVTWGLSLSSNSNSTASGSGLGTITAGGLYTAPTTIPSCAAGITQCEIQVVATATSVANTTYSGQALINVHVVVSLSPVTDTIGQGANLQYEAIVTGTSNQGINWAAACTASCASGQGGGAFDPINTGLYIAPPLQQGVTTGQLVNITATSDFDQTQVATATTTVMPSDPLGAAAPSTASGAQLASCPTFSAGLSGATCYQVNTSCDGVADYSVYLKVNTPSGTPMGTVIFGTGTGGSALYDNDPDFFYNNGANNGGLDVVQGVLSAGYTTVQISFGSPFDTTPGTVNGWLQGPGGVRRLACRYATVANWVYQNIHNANPSAPYCATGNSGGAGAIGYAVSEYGLGPIFAMIEPTSGPVMTRLDLGCSPQGTFNYGGATACSNAPTNMSYSPGTTGTADIIDTAYQSVGSSTPTLCSDGINGGNSANTLRFQSDSIDFAPSKSPALPIPNPPTVVKVLFGGQDTSNAVPQGETWWKSVGPTPTQVCVQNAPHPIPADPTGAGATQIVNDITSLCKLQ